MEGKADGYNRYKVIFNNIKALCNVIGEPKNVIEGPLEGITEENCEEDCKHYILGNGLHVYIRDEYIYISETDVQYWGDERGRNGDELGQFYISYNKESVECICHADSGRPYTLVQYFNHELDEGVVVVSEEEVATKIAYGRIGIDNVCIPHSFKDWKKTSVKSGAVPADIAEAITQHIGENTQQEVRAVCNKIIALNEKIKEYESMLDIEKLLQNEQELIELRRALEEFQYELENVEQDNIDILTEIAVGIKGKEIEIERLESEMQRIKSQIKQRLEKEKDSFSK